MTRLVAALMIALLETSVAAAWSGPAHQAIGEAAQDQLSPQARAALARTLQNADSLAPGALAGVAIWPDDLRARLRHHTVPDSWGPADSEEADQFNAANPGQGAHGEPKGAQKFGHPGARG
jgi:hypothetical protein